MIDVKKLITGFLILAAVASSSAFALSRLGGMTTTARNPALQLADSSQAISDNNAFVPNQTGPNNPVVFLPDSSSTASDTSSNLTDTLLNGLVGGIVSANPDGPQLDQNGNPTMATPDAVTIAGEIASSSVGESFQVPDWDLEAGEQPLRIVSSSQENTQSYMNGLVGILNTYFVKTNLESTFSQSSTTVINPDIIGMVASSSEGALSDAIGLQTPDAAANFQKTFIKLLVYQKNISELAENAQQDPAKSVLILQAEMPKYNQALQDFKDAFQQATGKNLSDTSGNQPSSNSFAFFNQIFGIPTAHAQWAVFDLTSFLEEALIYIQEYASYVQEVMEWIQSELLQVLKNSWVVLLQNNVMSWIQGKGNPRFVQSWTKTLQNSFGTAANSMVTNVVPNISAQASFGGLVSTVLQPEAAPTLQINPTLDSELSADGTDEQDFFDNFQNGGLDAYMTLFEPDNNLFGAAMDTADAADEAAANQTQATEDKTIAANGFTGDDICDDGSTPIDEVCDDGTDPIINSPGETTDMGLSNGLGSGLQLVVNANNLWDLLTAVATDFLSSITKGANLISVGPNGYVSTAPSSTIPASSTQPTPPAGVVYPTSTGECGSSPC